MFSKINNSNIIIIYIINLNKKKKLIENDLQLMLKIKFNKTI